MDTSSAILQVAAILIFARLLGELAARVGVPPVIGEILAGVAVNVLLAASLLPRLRPLRRRLIRLAAPPVTTPMIRPVATPIDG